VLFRQIAAPGGEKNSCDMRRKKCRAGAPMIEK
jgi:hypothetical protein